MIKIFIFLLLILSGTSFAQQDSLFDQKPVSHKKDTVIILQKEIYNSIGENKESLTSNFFDWQKSMPWIGAILIGILTIIANIIISRSNRKLSLKITEQEINNSKEIALAQIANAKEAMILDFNKSVISGSKQVWINDFIELISSILTKTNKHTFEKLREEGKIEELKFLITKAILMLNETEDSNLISALSSLNDLCLEILIGNKETDQLNAINFEVKSLTSIKLKREWEIVKNPQ